MNTVAVLMSTYNGEKFIAEQIDSILAQEEIEVALFIRDDGSSDRTVEIIEEYQTRYENIFFSRGSNIGVGNSFMSLVYEAGMDFDYYSFSDQDDIWLSSKLINAIHLISEKKTPTLYCSNQTLIDETERIIGMRFSEVPNYEYKQIMCKNKISGCTMVWNKELQIKLSQKERRPSSEMLKSRIHDVWVLMVSAVIGEIVYDCGSYILYRQHENNVVGVRKTPLVKEWKKKIRNPEKRNGRSLLCDAIISGYYDLIREDVDKTLICNIAYYQSDMDKKIALLKDRTIIKYSHESYLGYVIKVMLNLI